MLFRSGMRRRLDLALGLVVDAQVLFLDEPTTGLDTRSRQALWEIVGRLADSGITVLLTTQYLEEADQLADDIVVIDKGRVIAHGTSEQLKDRIGGDRIEIAVVDAAAAGRAVDVIRTVSTGEPTLDELRISAPVTGGSTVLVDAIRALDQQGIEVSDLVLRRPTLDDVFLALTGHAAEDDTAPPPPSGRRGRRR